MIRKFLTAVFCVAALCSCATPPPEQDRTPLESAVMVQRLVAAAENARAAGSLEGAEEAYRQAAAIEPANPTVQKGIASIAAERKHRVAVAEAEALLKSGDEAGAKAKAAEVLAENPAQREARSLMRRIEEKDVKAAMEGPKLTAALRRPVTLEFREASLKAVFELLSKSTGLNFVFDRDVKPDLKTTVFVKNTAVDEVIRFILVTNQLERKVLNENTILIYPLTPAKQRDYKDLVVRSFYLANADAKQTATMLRALVKTRDLYVDDKLNLVVIRDTPEAVRLAEKLVANQDLGEPEVMLELEVMEVGTSLLTQLGVQWPGQVNVGLVGSGNTAGTVTGKEFAHLNSGLIRLSFGDPLFSINLKKQDGRTNVLANPRIRVKNKEKARIHIGDKVPVITTTATSTGFVSETVNYLDVGLKLEVEPTVYLEDDVGIKVGLEVSNIAREIRSPSGSVTYQVGTRNTATTLPEDGETQVLAGLISDEDRRSANKMPGLGDAPGVLGKLFGAHSQTANKTEIVLLITPRVVRNLNRPGARAEQFVSGTEGATGAAPLVLPGAPLPASAPLPPAMVLPRPEDQVSPPGSPQPDSTTPAPPSTPGAPGSPAQKGNK
jgi:general secretion pathway protein D